MCDSLADDGICVKLRCGCIGSRDKLAAGLKLRLLLWRWGGSRDSCELLGLLLVVGLAGIVSKSRPGGGDVDAITVCRFWMSTDDVSQESKLSFTVLDLPR